MILLRKHEMHGLHKTPEYRAWGDMVHRCENSNQPAYKHYGGRGIKVCKRWRHSFLNFYKDMGAKPSKKHSIDRINNDKDYKPSNCKWSTWTEQAVNKRKKLFVNGKKTTSIYIGVRKIKNRWDSRIRLDGKRLYLGLFSSQEDAAEAYNNAVRKYRDNNKEKK